MAEFMTIYEKKKKEQLIAKLVYNTINAISDS